MLGEEVVGLNVGAEVVGVVEGETLGEIEGVKEGEKVVGTFVNGHGDV